MEINLDKLVNIEKEYLRKKLFKYKRIPSLINPIKLEWSQDVDYEGEYEFDSLNNKNIIRLNDFHRYYNNKFEKKVHMNFLTSTIRHELIHAFTQENFETLDIFKNMKSICDYSFIFLSILYWLGETSDYKGVEQESFTKTKWYLEKVKPCKTFDELRSNIIFQVLRYKAVIKSLEEKYLRNKKIIKFVISQDVCTIEEYNVEYDTDGYEMHIIMLGTYATMNLNCIEDMTNSLIENRKINLEQLFVF